MGNGTKGTLYIGVLAAMAASGCVVHGTGRGPLYASGGVTVRRHAHGSVRYAVYDSGGPQAVVVHVPPPAPRPAVAARPARPSSSAVWVGGHWDWNGSRWVWVPGRWVVSPGAGYVWVPPRTVRVGGRIQFFPGHWRRGGAPVVEAHPAPSAVPAPSRGGSGRVPSAVPAPSRGGSGGVPSAVPAPSRGGSGGVPSAVPAPSATPAPSRRPAPSDAHHGVSVSVGGQAGVHVEAHADSGSAVVRPAPRVAGGTVSGSAVVRPAPGAARCRLAIHRVPPGGMVRMTVSGAPARGAIVVRLGGRVLPVMASRRRGGRLDLQVRVRGAASGPLSVRVGGVRVGCGTLEVLGR